MKQSFKREQNKKEQLKKLDHKVKAPGKIVSAIIGTIGALVMEAGWLYAPERRNDW